MSPSEDEDEEYVAQSVMFACTCPRCMYYVSIWAPALEPLPAIYALLMHFPHIWGWVGMLVLSY